MLIKLKAVKGRFSALHIFYQLLLIMYILINLKQTLSTYCSCAQESVGHSTDSRKRTWRAAIYYTYLSTNESKCTSIGHFDRTPIIGIIE